jgi:hypothetical protein
VLCTWYRGKTTAAAGKAARRDRAQFLGLQYIAFALGDPKTSALSPDDAAGFDAIIKVPQRDKPGDKTPGDFGRAALRPDTSNETTT